MKKLWQKNDQKLDQFIEVFETKGDLLMDQKLLRYDVQGSLAHATMLNKNGILTDKEFVKLKKGLSEILKLDNEGKFKLQMKLANQVEKKN